MVNQAFDDPDIEEVITNVETKQKTIKVCDFVWLPHQVVHQVLPQVPHQVPHQVLHQVLHQHKLT